MKNPQTTPLISILSASLIVAYLCIAFIPNWQAVDKIAPQWLIMAILNGVSLLFLLYHRSYFSKAISTILSSFLTITYLGFVLWAACSYFYAINSTEVLVNISRQGSVFLMVILIAVLLLTINNKMTFIAWTLSLILVIEVYAVIVEAQEMIKTAGVISSGVLKGVTANRNITAFSIAIKIPFVLFLLQLKLKRFFKVLLVLLVFLSLVCLSMIQSRASFIGVGLILAGYLVLNGLLFIKEKNRGHLYRLGNFLLPLLLAIIVNQTYLSTKGADAISRAATISVSTNDGSVNQRLRYYEDVLTHVTSNPIFGVGLGNWKLKSIDYDSKDISGYVVPYHAHSDFIQLGAELGIFGFILYLGIFIWALFFGYRLIRYSTLSDLEKTFIFLLLVALGVYSVDANLNFPIARPQVLVVWAAVIALLTGYYQKTFNSELSANKKFNFGFLVLAIIAVLPTIYVSNQVYKSLKGQMFLLQDFNTNKYTVSLDQVDDIVPDIPNITVTTIPLKSVKARYYVNAKKYDKALALLEEGTSANPYLFYSELLKSQIYSAKGQLDSAKHYAKLAFNGLPNNQLHAATYLNLISQTSDANALEEAFELLTAKNDLNNWKNYLILAKEFFPPQDPILIERAKNAVGYFPENSEIKSLYNIIAIGNNNMAKSSEASARGLSFFNQKDFKNAAVEFEKAIVSNPLDYAHYENAATANYMISNFEKALQQINVVVNTMNPLNGKCEYIKALILIRLGDNIEACSYLNTSLKSGYSTSKAVLEQNCK